MSDLNSINIIGRIATLPELKYTKHGTPLINFQIANNKRIKKNGESIDKVCFFSVVIYRKLAEAIAPYLRKGARVAVSGELDQQRWEQNGIRRSGVEIIVSDIQLLEPKAKQATDLVSDSDPVQDR